MAETPRPINSPRRSPLNLDKPLPSNIEAERMVLGAVLLDNAALEIALRVVSPGDFFLPQHRYIMRAMTALKEKSSIVDSVTLVEALAKNEQLEAAGGPAYISQLTDGLPKISAVIHHAKIIAEKSEMRKAIYRVDDVYRRLLIGDGDVPSLKKTLIEAFREELRQSPDSSIDINLVEFLTREFPTPEHLVESWIPRGGSILVVAMPHHLKSWFTAAITLGATVPGVLMERLEVPKPVRTFLVSIEDPAAILQMRMRELIKTRAFQGVDLSLARILPRTEGGFDIMDGSTFAGLIAAIKEHKADLVILDVLRRFFRGDINSPQESGALCEQFDRIRDQTGAALMVVHHENRKQADTLQASAGSFNFPGWANVVMRFHKKTQDGHTSSVEIEVDNKLASSPDPVRMTLDLTADNPLRMESLEETTSLSELRDKLGSEWTVRDLAEALDVHKANAYRRLKKLQKAGLVEKVTKGKAGRRGGLAHWCFVQDASVDDGDLPSISPQRGKQK